MLDSILVAKFFDIRAFELGHIIHAECLWDAKTSYYILPQKGFDILISDAPQMFNFHPFRKVINAHQEVLLF